MVPRGYMTPRLAREQDPTPHDIIWAAGFFEGDGTCRRLVIGGTEDARICQKNREPLDKLRRLFGGSVVPQVDKRNSEWELWRWVVTGARARGFLMSIYELLSSRRQQQVRAALGIEQED